VESEVEDRASLDLSDVTTTISKMPQSCHDSCLFDSQYKFQGQYAKTWKSNYDDFDMKSIEFKSFLEENLQSWDNAFLSMNMVYHTIFENFLHVLVIYINIDITLCIEIIYVCYVIGRDLYVAFIYINITMMSPVSPSPIYGCVYF
jgi:hypothetical protein